MVRSLIDRFVTFYRVNRLKSKFEREYDYRQNYEEGTYSIRGTTVPIYSLSVSCEKDPGSVVIEKIRRTLILDGQNLAFDQLWWKDSVLTGKQTVPVVPKRKR